MQQSEWKMLAAWTQVLVVAVEGGERIEELQRKWP